MKMKDSTYLPEGRLYGTAENAAYTSSLKMLEKAMREEKIVEGIAECCLGEQLDLVVGLGCIKGVIPRSEAALEGDGTSSPKDIAVITRVGRPVCFIITDIINENGAYKAILSRKKAQKRCREEYIARLTPGDVIDSSVTHLDPFGAFVDIGCGTVSLLSVDCISVSRISHPSERLKKGQALKVVVKSCDEAGRIYVSLRELLGTWEENADCFTVGSTVAGIVRSIEDYGIFVELAPNLAGLAERKAGVEVGDNCAVFIKNIIKERMKVKLSIVDSYAPYNDIVPLKYYVDTSVVRHIDKWRYSPLVCPRIIESVFE